MAANICTTTKKNIQYFDRHYVPIPRSIFITLAANIYVTTKKYIYKMDKRYM